MTNAQRIFTLANNLLLIHGLGYSDGSDYFKVPKSRCVETSRTYEWLRYPNEACSQNVIEMNLLDIPVCVHNNEVYGAFLFVVLIPTKEEAGVLRCIWMDAK